MKPEDYFDLAQRTEAPVDDAMIGRFANPEAIRLIHGILGKVTEAGELADQLKRHLFYGAKLDVFNLMEELGDSDWYSPIILSVLGVTQEEVWEKNIAKLKKRFPEKFEKEEALNRDLEGERKVLEGNQCWGNENSVEVPLTTFPEQPIQVGPGPNGDYGIPFDGGSGTTPSPETLAGLDVRDLGKTTTVGEELDKIAIKLYCHYKAAQWTKEPEDYEASWERLLSNEKAAWRASARFVWLSHVSRNYIKG